MADGMMGGGLGEEKKEVIFDTFSSSA